MAAQQQKIQQQQALINNAAEAGNKPVSQGTSASGAPASPDGSTSAQPGAPTSSATFLIQTTGETSLSPAGVSRLDSSAHVIERMLNQNSYDDIAQGNATVDTNFNDVNM